jgi:predicted cupin superfamily sugar epimerase
MERVHQLIKALNLQPHPEGGYYAEIYRSALTTETDTGTRNLMTSIYFLLTSDNISKFHSIAGQEIWFHHEGSPLSVHVLDASGYRRLKVGPVGKEDNQPQVLVPEGCIFGSTVDEPDSYCLVSCTVAPGFDFRDFHLYAAEELLEKWPEHWEVIRRLT